MANRLAARLTPHVFTATASAGLRARPADRHSAAPGDPRTGPRPRPAGRPGPAGLAADRPTLLVTGGSQGARRLNEAVLGAQRSLAAAGIQVLHIAGAKNPLTAPDRAADEPPYVVLPYLDTMADGYAAADFVLCRSGAMTCAELTAVGLPAGYVPLPLRGGEQRLNAEPIVAAGGGLMVADENLDPAWVAQNVTAVLSDPPRLAAMAAAARRAGARDAGDGAGRVRAGGGS